MKKMLNAVALMFVSAALVSAQGASAVVHGTVKNIDAAAKSVVVAAGNGASELVYFADSTVVHGAAAGAKDAFHGIKEGAVIAAHTAAAGGKRVALEIDVLGKDGLKETEGTLSKVEAGGKRVVVKAADGSEQAFEMTAHATAHAARTSARQAGKAGKATVYYTEQGGKKVVHFFKHL